MRLLSWLGLSSSGLSSVDTWALSNADRCSPDELIAAACIESFAKDFPDWDVSNTENFGLLASRWKDDCSTRGPRLRNFAKSIDIQFIRHAPKGAVTRAEKNAIKSLPAYRYADFDYTHYYCRIEGCTLNGVMLDNSVTQRLVAAWQAADAAHKALVETERKAREAMELNEKKWDLAESLFGFKRTPEGALVASACQGNCEDHCPTCYERWSVEPCIIPATK